MRRSTLPLAASLIAALPATALAQNTLPALANAPLFLSTSVVPNVMLLFDSSGSMENIIWASAYNPATTYANWSPQTCGDKNKSDCWLAADSNVRIPDQGSCAKGYSEGSNGKKTQCLKLPDPAGSSSTYYSGNYLNYLFATYAGSGNKPAPVDLTKGQIPSETRLAAAKRVSTSIVNGNPTLRWGLSRFNQSSSNGGSIVADCGSTPSTVTSAIGAISANSATPLAETYYEVTRYFRGLAPNYNKTPSTYTSPVQYRCQKNFVIVVTDGFPTNDSQFPSNDPDDVANTFASLPNWDGKTTSTKSADYPFFPRYSDGFGGSGNGASNGSEGQTLYLDDLAKFGFDVDLKKSGNDLSGASYEDANFKTQRLQTYAIGLAINNQMLKDAAEYGQGKSYTANDADQLQSVLQSTLNDIAARTSAAAAVATNSTRLSSETAIYQARFATGDWTGQLLALPVKLDGSVGTPLWDAGTKLPTAANRKIFTYDPTRSANSRGRAFTWNDLNTTQQAALNRDAGGTVDSNGSKRVSWLRGDRSDEGDAAPAFRRRNTSTVLGDIVNSDPAFAGQQDYGYSRLPGTEGSSYTTFRNSTAYKDRPSMIYVGANDGMLHGFRASDGVELLAYVPNAVYPGLSALTAQNYGLSHRYFVDGAVRALDARVNGAWKTVVLGTLGGGGKAVMALDATDPAGFNTGNVMWEFNDAGGNDMGHSYPQATVVRLASNQWAAVIANGYNSVSGKAVLYLVNLDDGSVIRKFDTGVAGNNGMSSPIPVDADGDRITDYLYAGDLKGNLWKIDLRASVPASWDFALKSGNTPQPLYRACSAATCTDANRQPITARPEVGVHPDGGYLVYFGTGSYFLANDNASTTGTNTFYAIWDKANGSAPPTGRNNLLQQQVTATVTQQFGTQTEKVRVTTNNEPAADDLGWYLDLPATNERQVSTPILRGGSVIFTTLIPNTTECSFGGDSFLMEVDAVTGSRLLNTPFDLNRDTAFNLDDQVVINGVRYPVSGRQSKEGIIKTPTILSAGAFEVKLASGTTGGIDITIEPPPGAEPGGRLSWRQLR